MRFEDFRRAVEANVPDWSRKGQAAFNGLHEVRPDLSEQIRAHATLDPFYRDERLPAFWEWVEQNWEAGA